MREDFEQLTDYQRHVAEQLALGPCARDVAQLVRAGADIARQKHIFLRDMKIRMPLVAPGINQHTLERAKGMPVDAVADRLRMSPDSVRQAKCRVMKAARQTIEQIRAEEA